MTEIQNPFAPMAEQMFQLYTALLHAGFTDERAFELSKTYCSVAFMNQYLRSPEWSHDKYTSYEKLRKLTKERMAKLSEEETK